MDPLSEIISLLKPTSYGFRGLDAGGDWTLAYDASGGIKCFAVSTGTCWLSFEDGTAPVRLTDGDLVLLSGRKAFRLSSSPEVPSIGAMQLLQTVAVGETAELSGGGDCAGVGGGFMFEGHQVDLLLGALPPVVHISAEADKATLHQSIQRLMQELRDPSPDYSRSGLKY